MKSSVSRFSFLRSFLKRQGFPGGSDSKEYCNVEDLGLIPGLGRSSAEGIDYPLQYAVLENFMDRGAWQATVQEVAKSQTQPSSFNLAAWFTG